MPKASFNLGGWRSTGEIRARRSFFGFTKIEERCEHRDGRHEWGPCSSAVIIKDTDRNRGFEIVDSTCTKGADFSITPVRITPTLEHSLQFSAAFPAGSAKATCCCGWEAIGIHDFVYRAFCEHFTLARGK